MSEDLGTGARRTLPEAAITRDEMNAALLPAFMVHSKYKALALAAPALLAALKEIIDFCDDPEGSEKPESLAMGLGRMLPAARAALAKAAASPDECAVRQIGPNK